jgi:hypothetical protein
MLGCMAYVAQLHIAPVLCDLLRVLLRRGRIPPAALRRTDISDTPDRYACWAALYDHISSVSAPLTL